MDDYIVIDTNLNDREENRLEARQRKQLDLTDQGTDQATDHKTDQGSEQGTDQGTNQVTDQVTDQGTDQVSDQVSDQDINKISGDITDQVIETGQVIENKTEHTIYNPKLSIHALLQKIIKLKEERINNIVNSTFNPDIIIKNILSINKTGIRCMYGYLVETKDDKLVELTNKTYEFIPQVIEKLQDRILMILGPGFTLTYNLVYFKKNKPILSIFNKIYDVFTKDVTYRHEFNIKWTLFTSPIDSISIKSYEKTGKTFYEQINAAQTVKIDLYIHNTIQKMNTLEEDILSATRNGVNEISYKIINHDMEQDSFTFLNHLDKITFDTEDIIHFSLYNTVLLKVKEYIISIISDSFVINGYFIKEDGFYKPYIFITI